MKKQPPVTEQDYEILYNQQIEEIGCVISATIERAAMRFSIFDEKNSRSSNDEKLSFISILRCECEKRFKDHVYDSGMEPTEVIQLHQALVGSMDVSSIRSNPTALNKGIKAAFDSSPQLCMACAAGYAWTTGLISMYDQGEEGEISQSEWFVWFENIINVVHEFNKQPIQIYISGKCIPKTTLYKKLSRQVRKHVTDHARKHSTNQNKADVDVEKLLENINQFTILLVEQVLSNIFLTFGEADEECPPFCCVPDKEQIH